MADIKKIAGDYIVAGWSVVPIPHGSKGARDSWNKKTYTPDDFGPDDNIAGKCGDKSQHRVDIDCDVPEAAKAATLLLPNTGLVHGRKRSPASHLWFRCADAKTKAFKNLDDGDKDKIIEIRATGTYTVLPPSIHPSGEPYEWDASGEPLNIAYEDLYPAVVDVALVALILRQWESLDHDSMGHLAGFWLQAGLRPDRVIRLFQAIGHFQPEFAREILTFARSTIAKFENKEKVTGGPKLAEAIGSAVALMRSWLGVADNDAIEEMNARHFWVLLGTTDAIGREDMPEGTRFQPVRRLYSEYANRKVAVGVDKHGDAVLKPLFPAWLESPARRSYRQVAFAPPPLKCDERDYNLWKGFEIDPKPGTCSRFLDFVHDIICSRNDAHFTYLLKVIARLFQQPGLPGEVAVAMRGPRGAGKGTLMRALSAIIGRRHYAHLDRTKDMTGFNALISGKVLVFADEVNWRDRDAENVLKRIITEPTLRIERKGVDSVEEANCLHLFMATNDARSAPAGFEERRFFTIEVSGEKKQQASYFDPIYDEFKNGGLAAFLHMLLNWEVFDLDGEVRAVPKTRELATQQDLSMPPAIIWLKEALEEAIIVPGTTFAGPTEWPRDDMPERMIANSVTYAAYLEWFKERRYAGQPVSPDAFGMQVGAIMSGEPSRMYRPQDTSKPIRGRALRTLREARIEFDKRRGKGAVSEWPELLEGYGGVKRD